MACTTDTLPTSTPVEDGVVAPLGSNIGQADPTRTFVRGSALLVFGRGLSLVLNLATQVTMVRYLSKLDYGTFAFALALVSLATSLSTLGLSKGVIRFVAIYHEQADYRRMFGTMLLSVGAILGMGTAVVLLVIGLQGVIARFLVDDPLSVALLLVMIVLAPVNALDSLLVSLCSVFAGARSIFLRRYVLGPGMKLAATVAVVAVSGDVYLLTIGYVAAGVIGMLLYAALLLQVLRSQGLFHECELRTLVVPAREVLGFSVPLLLSDLAFLLRTSAVVLFLAYFHAATEVAEFRAVLPVARLNEIVLVNFSILFIPAACRLLARKDGATIDKLYWRTAAWVTVLSFPLFATTCSLSRPLTVALFGEAYASSGQVLAVLSLGFYVTAAFGLNAWALNVFGRLRWIVCVEIVVTVFALAANLWLVPLYGAPGAAAACCMAQIAYALLNHIGLRLRTSISLFRARYFKVYAVVVLCLLALLEIQSVFSPPIHVGLLLVGVASLVVGAVARSALDVGATFPELARFPVIRHLVNSP